MPKLVKIKQSKSKQVASIDAQATTPPDTGNKLKEQLLPRLGEGWDGGWQSRAGRVD